MSTPPPPELFVFDHVVFGSRFFISVRMHSCGVEYMSVQPCPPRRLRSFSFLITSFSVFVFSFAYVAVFFSVFGFILSTSVFVFSVSFPFFQFRFRFHIRSSSSILLSVLILISFPFFRLHFHSRFHFQFRFRSQCSLSHFFIFLFSFSCSKTSHLVYFLSCPLPFLQAKPASSPSRGWRAKGGGIARSFRPSYAWGRRGIRH